jgi:hypothetical protein
MLLLIGRGSLPKQQERKSDARVLSHPVGGLMWKTLD